MAELVIRDLADERSRSAQGGDPDDCVCDGPARNLHCRAHVVVEAFDCVGIDKLHGALGGAVALQECVVATSDDVDDGVADSNDVVAKFGHVDRVPCVICGAL